MEGDGAGGGSSSDEESDGGLFKKPKVVVRATAMDRLKEIR